jgi:hypothetical protein
MVAYALRKFIGDIATLFSGRNLPWHVLAIALTYVAVVTGLDGWVSTVARQAGLRDFARLGNAGFVGFFMPFALPLIALALGWLRRNKALIRTGLLIAQAEITGLLLSFFYKALTGRPGPSGFRPLAEGITDPSTVFQFGFLRGGVFWGWPSSHITVAVSAAVVLMVLYRHNAVVKYLALLYAVYMALSVSVTFHWFSDGIAAIIFGSLVGLTVVRSVRSVKT